MGPVSNTSAPVRGGGHEDMSAVSSEPGAGGEIASVRARDEGCHAGDGDVTSHTEERDEARHREADRHTAAARAADVAGADGGVRAAEGAVSGSVTGGTAAGRGVERGATASAGGTGRAVDGGGADPPLALPRVGRWHVLKLPAEAGDKDLLGRRPDELRNCLFGFVSSGRRLHRPNS